MTENNNVGMGEYRTGKSPELLVSLGLGSCVGVCLFDSEKKIGGLAHIMLPTVKETGLNSDFEMTDILKLEPKFCKYADVAIPKMLNDMKNLGVNLSSLTAKIAGGAHMFVGLDDNIQVGKRNAESVRGILSKNNIKLLAEETGGSLGRTIKFNLDDGKLSIKTKDGENSI